ncbi:hypothetical protein LCGC14_1213740 [marine sediment metagenome]|uniref:Uncharacterized protein n=1 Tax=marine sediment metagenome TaxID=412755 RepID=A0A0F9M0P6_9ZZZZ
MFKAVQKAGTAAKALTSTFTTTNRLLGMPGQVATTGLDALAARFVGPISGAIAQGIGELTVVMNQILGPALSAIGKQVGGFIQQNKAGAGIGGLIGAGATALTGIPGLDIAGGIIGGGFEALFKEAAKSPTGISPNTMFGGPGGFEQQFLDTLPPAGTGVPQAPSTPPPRVINNPPIGDPGGTIGRRFQVLGDGGGGFRGGGVSTNRTISLGIKRRQLKAAVDTTKILKKISRGLAR